MLLYIVMFLTFGIRPSGLVLVSEAPMGPTLRVSLGFGVGIPWLPTLAN